MLQQWINNKHLKHVCCTHYQYQIQWAFQTWLPYLYNKDHRQSNKRDTLPTITIANYKQFNPQKAHTTHWVVSVIQTLTNKSVMAIVYKYTVNIQAYASIACTMHIKFWKNCNGQSILIKNMLYHHATIKTINGNTPCMYYIRLQLYWYIHAYIKFSTLYVFNSVCMFV